MNIITDETIEQINSAMNKLYEILKEFAVEVCKVFNKIADVLKIHDKTNAGGSKMTFNPRQSYLQYNYTKPNTKPYSAFK